MSGIAAFDEKQPDTVETATFAMGCFWGPDARFGVIPGVVHTRVGYAGGDKENPTYHDLDGHTETLQIDYDPDTVSYTDLLPVFWKRHNPHRQAFRTQYRHICFTHTAEQEEAASTAMQQIEGDTGQPVKTDIRRLDTFHVAEDYHQKYHLRQHDTILNVFTQAYTEEELRESTAAARINGFLAGYGTDEQVNRIVSQLDLPEPVATTIRDRYTAASSSITERIKNAAKNICSI